MRHLHVMWWAIVLAGSTVSLWSQTAPPGEGAKRALIITNTEYKNLPRTPVDNSGAKALEEALHDAQFTVSVNHDLNLNSLQEVIKGFQADVHPGDIALIYYAGYMKQVRQNYLLPVDFDPALKLELYYSAYDLWGVLENVAKNKPKLTILLLDASWDTPKLSGQAGFTIPDLPSDTWMLASVGPDQVTAASQVTDDKMGFFTSALVKVLPLHGLDLTELVSKVQADVLSASKDAQRPYPLSNFGSKFYFHVADPSGEKVNNKDRLSYVYIPPGKFWMGCVPASEAQCSANEKPRHRVEITKGFWLGQTEVTNLAYNERFARPNKLPLKKATGITNAGRQGDLPVVGVTWEEAQKYCNWTAEGGRLPTEAEWERSARGGIDDNVYPYPDLSTSRDYANFMGKHGNDLFDDLAPVKQFNPNQYKLYDMAGNVWEWTLDWFDAAYYAASPKEPPIRDPQGPAQDKGEGHIARGGSWFSDAKTYLRISYRKPFKSGSNNIGFRCLVPDTPEAMKNFK